MRSRPADGLRNAVETTERLLSKSWRFGQGHMLICQIDEQHLTIRIILTDMLDYLLYGGWNLTACDCKSWLPGIHEPIWRSREFLEASAVLRRKKLELELGKKKARAKEKRQISCALRHSMPLSKLSFDTRC
mmetsp:Transcript_30782/g.71043  ORF Transcript_30782/g.71043 Transcript_30782/m.71043 type:complete len:132 (+) Transcript_30782:542-937(+)